MAVVAVLACFSVRLHRRFDVAQLTAFKGGCQPVILLCGE
uniref:Uncharacterized protein n=1 Tax=Escherichia phage Baskent_phicoli_1 TaxID=3145031 RepID=A0AAU8B8P6_9CAUD